MELIAETVSSMDIEYAASKDSKTEDNRNITVTKVTAFLFTGTTPSKVTDHGVYKNYVLLDWNASH